MGIMKHCAIVAVSGPRAAGHAAAYAHIRGGTLKSISTRNEDNLHAFGERFHIDASHRFTDYAEMFSTDKPDCVHINTPPNARLNIVNAAINAGVPALIIEKPIALDVDDYL